MPFHTVSVGNDIDAFERGLKQAYALAGQLGVEVIYLAPTMNTVSSVAAVKVMQQSVVDDLIKKGEFTLGTVRFVLETLRTRKSIGPAVLFGVYVPHADMVKAMADYRIKESVYIPWSEPDLPNYLAKHPASVAV